MGSIRGREFKDDVRVPKFDMICPSNPRYCFLVRYDECWVCAFFADMTELAGDSAVYLTKERYEWLIGRCVSYTWDMGESTAKKDEIVRGNKVRVESVL